MNTHQIRREYSSKARGRAGGTIKNYLKHIFKRLLKGEGANLSKIKPINQKKDFKELSKIGNQIWSLIEKCLT